MSRNLDPKTVASFEDEWSRFDQGALSEDEAERIFEEYFSEFPWHQLPPGATGFDMGCGSGRWARWAAPRVGHLHCIDPSGAIEVARANLTQLSNVSFHRASVDDGVLPPESQDFGYCLGVLHHVPDTPAGLRACVKLLKPGAPFLVYLYYALENRSRAFRWLWRATDLLRQGISRLPATPKHVATDAIALLVYLPLARAARLLESLGLSVQGIPLSHYRAHSFYTMRTDSRDRFGTPLEQRFTRDQIARMMQEAGLVGIQFRAGAPYWCAVGFKA
ncbi:MAG: class I SAM-dependent methyltransferase [Pseudomonadota bacterium]